MEGEVKKGQKVTISDVTIIRRSRKSEGRKVAYYLYSHIVKYLRMLSIGYIGLCPFRISRGLGLTKNCMKSISSMKMKSRSLNQK